MTLPITKDHVCEMPRAWMHPNIYEPRFILILIIDLQNVTFGTWRRI